MKLRELKEEIIWWIILIFMPIILSVCRKKKMKREEIDITEFLFGNVNETNEKCRTCKEVHYARKGIKRCPSAECKARMEASLAKAESQKAEPPPPCEKQTPVDGNAGTVTGQLELPFVPP
jgi:hypothetical protein